MIGERTVIEGVVVIRVVILEIVVTTSEIVEVSVVKGVSVVRIVDVVDFKTTVVIVLAGGWVVTVVLMAGGTLVTVRTSLLVIVFVRVTVTVLRCGVETSALQASKI